MNLSRFSRLWARTKHYREDADLAEELQVHLEMQAEDLEATGLTPQEARRRAQAQLGRTRTIVERIRDQEFLTRVESWYRDLASGVRAMRRSPVFSLTAILTLAIGIGANTAIFTLLDGLLLRSLPVHNAGELALVGLKNTAAAPPSYVGPIPFLMMEELRREQRSFEDISTWNLLRVTTTDAEGWPQFQTAGMVSGNGFGLLGVKPHVGRLIAPSDDVRGGPPEGWPVVLSYAFWQDRFGGNPQVLGKELRFSGTLFTVIGVTPPSFGGVWPGTDPDLYLPWQFSINTTAAQNTSEGIQFCSAIARLKPGVSLREARAELAVYKDLLFREFIPESFRRNPNFGTLILGVDPGRTGLPSFFRRVYASSLFQMQALVAAVLLLCCVNVGGLMMSRVYMRQREFALRTAIGAARWRLIRQYLVESFLIALIGAAIGAGASWWGTGYLLPFFRHPNEGIGLAIHPDRSIFLVTALLAFVTTLVAGTLPAWRAGSADPGSLLKSRTSSGAARQLAGRTFIPVQVALSLVLVVFASSLSQSLVRLRTERTGFDVDHVTIQTAPFHLLQQSEAARLDLYQRMADRMEQMAGVRAVAVTWFTPMTSFEATADVQAVTGHRDSPEDPRMPYNEVGPAYFRAMNTAILEGREFVKTERRRDVCVLNQSAAAFLFPHQQAIGLYVRTTDPPRIPDGVICRVVGIAEDAKFANLQEAPPRTIYFPVTEETVRNGRNLVFLINAGSKGEAVQAYRATARELVPSLPLVLFATLRDQMEAALGSERAISLMSSLFAGIALFLSAIGLYALLSSSVVQRRGEIGVRMALGAARGRLLQMIVQEALWLLGAGMLLGGFGLYFSLRFVDKLLYGVSAFDPIRLATIAGVLLATTLAAAFIPALRAASIDPIQALRAE